MAYTQEAFAEYFKAVPSDLDMNDLDMGALPQHIALIMDGNGRWAKQQGKPRSYGHMMGVEGLRESIKACVRIGIPYLSVYAFSTENWKRPQDEVDCLMQLFSQTLLDELDLLDEEDVCLRVVGDLSNVPAETCAAFERAMEHTQANTSMVLSVVINYGSRFEIVRAVQLCAAECMDGRLSVADINEDCVAAHLYTHALPDPDLMIRTSGEKRLSNFFLWQLAYAELYTTPVLFPDFNRFDMVRAIIEFQKRSRRFGGVASNEG